jgi:oligosaccharyltransferase complex subunit alpha (ribophorin I)
MLSLAIATAVLSFASTAFCDSNLTKPLSSGNVLPASFKPPQQFKNVNLIHLINLEKSYPKETVNVVIENIAGVAASEYYIPFTSEQMEKIGNLEVRDKKDPELGLFNVEAVAIDAERHVLLCSLCGISMLTYSSDTQFYKITLPTPLEPKSQQLISITYSYLSTVYPLPATIDQNDSQYLVFAFSAVWPSSYVTLKQKTEVKFGTNDVPDYTTLPKAGSTPESPQKQGRKFTYGTFGEIPAGAYEPVQVRYEFTKPLIHVSELERDIEISHWGGNVAFEDRYTLHNHAANLSNHFSRVKWAMTSYNPQAPTTAIRDLKFPLRVGSLTPYYTDVIGNVSTSRFRSNKREANLEIKPRYPVFGGWNYPFRVGWDADLKKYLRKLKTGEGYILNVPFLEGPKQPEGIAYEHITLRIILPEGAV